MAAVVVDAEAVPEGRWSPTGTGIALRVLGSVALAYFTVLGGAYNAGPVIGVLSTIAMLSPFVVITSRLVARDQLATAATIVMIVCGALTTPFVSYVTGGYYFCGAILLIARMRLPLRVTVSTAAVAGGLLLTSVAWKAQPENLPSELLAYGAGILAAIFFGITRRQARQREAQDRALVDRSRELERRSAELIAQTELTQAEATKAAALEERGRIARDLHDVLAHSLGGLVVQLDAAEALLTERQDVPAAAERLRASRRLAVEGLREARFAVSELRDPDRAGSAGPDLVAAVRQLAYGPVGLHLGVRLDVLGEPVTVPGQVADAFIAVLREALTNVAKHAPGGQVTLTLVFESHAVRLELGNGLPDRAPTDLAATGAGLGLVGMRERMSAIGGTVTAGTAGRRWIVSAAWARP